MGHKTMRFNDGGLVFLRCLLDDWMDELLARNPNVL